MLFRDTVKVLSRYLFIRHLLHNKSQIIEQLTILLLSSYIPSSLSPIAKRVYYFIDQWNFELTDPYRTPSTLSSKTKPALSILICSTKSKFSKTVPFVVVKRVKRLFGTALRSVVKVQTLMSPFWKESGGESASEAIKSSSTINDCPGLKLRV